MAQDMAGSFNAAYGKVFVRPEALVPKAENLAKVPGLDGEKMSKSYGNDVWIFESGKALKNAVGRIKTDSRAPEEPKEPGELLLFQPQLPVAADELEQWKSRVRPRRSARGYGHLKQRPVEAIEQHFAGARKREESHDPARGTLSPPRGPRRHAPRPRRRATGAAACG
jgi:tryptophanyl-tRNA synthetase